MCPVVQNLMVSPGNPSPGLAGRPDVHSNSYNLYRIWPWRSTRLGCSSQQTDRLGAMYVARRVLVPGLRWMHQGLYLVILPPFGWWYLFDTLQVAHLVRHRLHNCIQLHILRHTSGQLHTHSGILDGIRLQIRSDSGLPVHGHERHQRDGRCLRCYQRRIFCGSAMLPHMAAHFGAKKTEDCFVRHFLPWSGRRWRKWRTNVLVDW